MWQEVVCFNFDSNANFKRVIKITPKICFELFLIFQFFSDVKNLKPSKPGQKQAQPASAPTGGASKTDGKENKNSLNKSGLEDEEDFFDFLTRFQSKRMDDQRCSLVVAKKPERFDFEVYCPLLISGVTFLEIQVICPYSRPRITSAACRFF